MHTLTLHVATYFCGSGGSRTLVHSSLNISAYRFQHYKHTNNIYQSKIKVKIILCSAK